MMTSDLSSDKNADKAHSKCGTLLTFEFELFPLSKSLIVNQVILWAMLVSASGIPSKEYDGVDTSPCNCVNRFSAAFNSSGPVLNSES